MQSLASLMSMKQADIGNLDDFEEENEEDEENKVNQEEKAAKITGDHTKKTKSLVRVQCVHVHHFFTTSLPGLKLTGSSTFYFFLTSRLLRFSKFLVSKVWEM